MGLERSEARDELQVLTVAPSTRAIWSLRRLTARARGRPRLAVRRVVAAAALAATQDVDEVISVNEGPSKRRRRCRSHAPQQTQSPSKDLSMAQLELAQLAQQKVQCEGRLAAEKRRCADLRAQHEVQLAAERHKAQVLRQKVASQEWEIEGLLREKARLCQRVKEMQNLNEPQECKKCKNRESRAPTARLDEQGLVKQIAEMECRPLRSKSPHTQSALKRKLLVKWHPDKQPSGQHVALATGVMQEMQNRPEWRG